MSIATCLYFCDVYSTAQCCQCTQVNGQDRMCPCSYKLMISRTEHMLIQNLDVRKGIAVVCQEVVVKLTILDRLMNTLLRAAALGGSRYDR